MASVFDKEGARGNGNEETTKKKLLILDINGLLLDSYFFSAEGRPSRSQDARVGRFYVYKRPHCEEFVKFCLQNFLVAIWSSAKEHNVTGLVDFVFGESKKLLTFVWDQARCTDTGFKSLGNKHKPLFLKELEKVWQSSRPDVPWDKGEFGPWNTLLIDDSPYKVLRNPDHTAVLAVSYSAAINPLDDFLLALETYLKKLIGVTDIQDFVRSNPFGEALITETSKDWTFYSKVKTNVSVDEEGHSVDNPTQKTQFQKSEENEVMRKHHKRQTKSRKSREQSKVRPQEIETAEFSETSSSNDRIPSPQTYQFQDLKNQNRINSLRKKAMYSKRCMQST